MRKRDGAEEETELGCRSYKDLVKQGEVWSKHYLSELYLEL